jgi:hypothetical protein
LHVGTKENKFISVMGRAAAKNVYSSVSIVSMVNAAINFEASYNAQHLSAIVLAAPLLMIQSPWVPIAIASPLQLNA